MADTTTLATTSPDTTLASTAPSTTSRLLERISVRQPYFAIEELDQLGGGMLTAVVPVQRPTAPECGAIEAAQVARHLAILGSCAAASSRDDDKRHHYLATKAHYTRLANAPAVADEPLRAEAVASWIDRRTARALVTLRTESGRGLNVLDVEYTVLAPKMFERLNGAPPSDPVVGPAEETSLIDGGVRVSSGPIPVDMCAGHFPGFPAAPVAIVMGRLCRTAGLALAHHLDRPDVPYRIEEGRVVASKLAHAGQQLVLDARYDTPVGDNHQLYGRAEADGELIGEVTVVLSTPDIGAEG